LSILIPIQTLSIKHHAHFVVKCWFSIYICSYLWTFAYSDHI